MPPIVALSLCLYFCFLVLRKDVKNHPEVSLVNWVPLLWMLRCASKSITFWLNFSASLTGEEIGNADFFYLSSLMGMSVLILARRGNQLQVLFRENAFLFLFFAYLAISCTWSPFVALSLKRWFRTMGDLMMALVILTEKHRLAAVAALFRRCALLFIPLSIILIKYYPSLGRAPARSWGGVWAPDMWVGVATHKNTLGQLCLVSSIYFVWSYLLAKREGRPLPTFLFSKIPLHLFYLGMSFYLINGAGHSRSTTSILCLGVAISVFFTLGRFPKWNLRYRYFLPLLGCVLIAAYSLNAISKLVFEKPLSEVGLAILGKRPDLTDRKQIWETVIKFGMQHPFLGAGYMAFWSGEVSESFSEMFSQGLGQAHDGYLELWAHEGFVGLGIFLIAIYVLLKSAVKMCDVDFEYGRLRLMLIITILVHNYSEAGFIRPNHLMWFVFLLVAINCPQLPITKCSLAVNDDQNSTKIMPQTSVIFSV